MLCMLRMWGWMWQPTAGAAAVSSLSPAWRYPVRLQEGPLLHFICSMMAGLACATTTAPVDLIKTRYMNQVFCGEGKPQRYANMADCALQVRCCLWAMHCQSWVVLL